MCRFMSNSKFKLIYIFLIILFPARLLLSENLEDVVRQKQGSVLLINCTDTNDDVIQASGFVISADGYVIASAHQVKNAKEIQGKLIDGQIFSLTLLYYSKEKDVSILKANRNFSSWVDINADVNVNAGTSVFTLASPDNLAFSVITGTVSNPNRLYKGNKVFQLTMYADPGASGAPVFNHKGDFIGMIIGKLEGTVFSLAISSEEIRKYLETTPIYEKIIPKSQTDKLNMLETEIIPLPNIDRTVLLAIEFYNKGVNSDDMKKKYEYYKKSAQLFPEFFEAWFNLGVVSEYLSDYQMAEKAYKRAITLDNQSIESKRNLGRLLLKMNRLEEAKETFESLVSLCSNCPQVYNDLGETLRRMNQLDKAEEYFNKAITLDSQYALAYYNLALIQLEKENEEEAIHYFTKYLDYTNETTGKEKVQRWINEMRNQKTKQ